MKGVKILTVEKVSIVGMGSLGLIFGSYLADKLGRDNVEFLMDEKRAEKYKDKIRKVNGREYDFKIVSGSETGELSDLLIFAVKSTSLDHAIDTVRNKVGRDTIILSLLNGITSEEIIGNAFGRDKLLYSIAEGMDPIRNGLDLEFTNMGYICIGSDTDDPLKHEKLKEVIDMFDRTGLPYKLEDDVLHRLWSKFMLNVGVNQVVMINKGTFGTVQKKGPARDQMIAAMREVITLAGLEKINVTETDLEFYISLVDTLNPEGMPSMRHDGLHRIKSEVEFFSGKVLELGRKHGVPTPVNDEIYHKVKEIEGRY